jgi:hypothetical protein
MVGVVGIWHKENPTPSLEGALATLRVLPTWTSHLLRPCQGLALGAVQPNAATCWAEQDALYLMLWGEPFTSLPHPQKLGPVELLTAFRKDSFSAWLNLDGSFVIVLVETNTRTLYIFNDRFGFLPVFYLSDDMLFCFGPAPKAVFKAAGKLPSLWAQGVACFLTCAYNFGANTIYEGLQRLEPSSILTLELDSLRLTTERYWNIAFQPAPQMRLAETIELLYAATVNSHKLLFCDRPASADIMLSGGMDSRAIMGMFRKLGPPPRRITAFGARADIPYSDAAIAAQIARDLGYRFEFLQLEPARFADMAPQWAMLSELSNDNFIWYASGLEGVRFYTAGTPDCVVRGDEAWGWHNLVENRREAVAAVLPPEPNALLRQVFKRDFLTDFTAWYQGEIDRVGDRCQNDLPNEVKDYLYVNIRVFGFIAPLGYYMAAPVRRPLLTLELFDCIRRLPCRLRANKVAFRVMMRNKMPEMMRYPVARTLGLPDWPSHVLQHGPSQELFARMLAQEALTSGVLGEILDRDKLQAIWNAFLSASESGDPVSAVTRLRILKGRVKDSLLSHAVGAMLLQRWRRSRLREGSPALHDVSEFTLLWRAVLVAMLQNELSTH